MDRRRARLRLNSSLRLWYHPEYQVDCLSKTARVSGLELDRGQRVLDRLTNERLVSGGAIHVPTLASLAELALVHSHHHLRAASDPQQLARVFGLHPSEIDVDCVLKAQRLAVGGTVSSADWAARQSNRIAFHLGGGFHHAAPDVAAGFCVVNDVAVAIRVLRREGFHAPIAIVDLDYHQGDGNIVTFAADESVFTYSIHGSTWSHGSAVADEQYLLPGGTTNDDYLGTLERTLPMVFARHNPKLVFYIAGNDVLAGDRLGDFALTPEGVLLRDRIVMELCRAHRSSVVVTLGGGYSSAAWQVTANFLRWVLTGRTEVIVTQHSVPREMFAAIAESLEPSDLQGDADDWSLTQADVLADLSGEPAVRRVLDYYSAHGIELALEKYGFLAKLRDKGFRDLRLGVDPGDRDRQRITIHGAKDHRHHLLMDLVVRRSTLPAPGGMEASGLLELVSVEWLQLQDPTAAFSLRHPRLPGQKYPGLGMVRDVIELLHQVCRRLDLDGVVMHPSQYHIAALAASECCFIDPNIQGAFDVVREATKEFDLETASRLIADDRLRASDGSIVSWVPGEFVAPVSPRICSYFASSGYKAQRAQAAERFRSLGISFDGGSDFERDES